MPPLHKLLPCLTLLILCGVFAPTGYADEVVVPNSLTNVDGNDFIFATTEEDFCFCRLQQVYAASQFSAFAGPRLITQIAFRGGRGTYTNPSLQINLSTTTRAPDALSLTYAENIGADETVARSGPITFNSGVGGPFDFTILFPLTTPFLYDPAQGNLLVDFRAVGQLFRLPADGHNQVGDSVSLIAGSVNSPTGLAGANSFGVVTQFTFTAAPTAVPEPATLLLLGTGLAGIAVKVRRRAKSQRS